MSFQCRDCTRPFGEQRGLSTHRRYCKARRKREEEEAEGPSRALKKTRHSNPSPDPYLGVNDGISTAIDCDIAPELDSEVPPAPLSPPPASFSFSGRKRKAPRALRDYIPHSLVGLPSHLRPAPPCPEPTPSAELEVTIPASTPDPGPELEPDPEFTTEANGFGLYHVYTRKPRTDPEENLTLEDLLDDAMSEQHLNHSMAASTVTSRSGTAVDFFHPFPNETVFRCMSWFLGESGILSAAGFDRFIREVILSDEFNREDLRSFGTARELTRLDKHGRTDLPFSADDGWKEGSVTLHIPKAKAKHASETASPQVPISGIYYRPLLEVIKAACQSSQAKEYHWVPFKLVHQSPTEDVRAYTDIYNSDAMLEEDAKIRAMARHPDDDPDTEVAILAMLLWSDSTHLASFGTASLWPVYLYFGNLSKYARGRPNAHAAHHIAYIPSVSLHPDPPVRDDSPFLSSPTLSKTLIARNMGLQQRLKFCVSSRSSLCKRYGS